MSHNDHGPTSFSKTTGMGFDGWIYRRNLAVRGKQYTIRKTASVTASNESLSGHHEVQPGSTVHQRLLAQQIEELSEFLVQPDMTEVKLKQIMEVMNECQTELLYIHQNRARFLTTELEKKPASPTKAPADLNAVSSPLTAQPDEESDEDPETEDIEVGEDGTVKKDKYARDHKDKFFLGEPHHVDKAAQLEELQLDAGDDDNDDFSTDKRTIFDFVRKQHMVDPADKPPYPWLEFFQDLLYIGAVAKIGHVLKYHMSLLGLAQFTLLFMPLLFHWVGIHTNRMHFDDKYHKFLAYVQLSLVCGMAIHTENAFNKDLNINTGHLYLMAYLFSMLCEVATKAYLAFHVKAMRKHLLSAVGVKACVMVPYIATCVVIQNNLTLGTLAWTASVVLELLFVIFFNAFVAGMTKNWGRYQARINVEEVTQRYGWIVMVVVGEVVVAILFDNDKAHPLLVPATTFLGLLIAFALQFIYFRVEAVYDARHAVRRSFWTNIAWKTMHFPLAWSITVVGSCIGTMLSVIGTHLRAVDSPSDHIPIGLLHWLLTSALATTFMVMGILGALHSDSDFLNPQTRKVAWRRVGTRIIVGALFVVLAFLGSFMTMFRGSVIDLIVASSLCTIAMVLEEFGHLRAALLNLVHL